MKRINGKNIIRGRSTPGEPQKIDAIGREWKQIGFMDETSFSNSHPSKK